MTKTGRIARIASLVSAVLLFSFGQGPTAWAEVLIIANPQAEITSLGRQKLKSIYLSSRSTWPNGMKIKLTILTADGPHQEFCQNFLNKSAAQLERHWRRQLYSGKALPPAERHTASEVIHYVRTTPGALGFIAGQPRPEGVVTVTISP